MIATLIRAVDDGEVLTIPNAWDVWARNGVLYRRCSNGVIVAPGDGVLVYFDTQSGTWRDVKNVWTTWRPG